LQNYQSHVKLNTTILSYVIFVEKAVVVSTDRYSSKFVPN
jgi:hypothetical protein